MLAAAGAMLRLHFGIDSLRQCGRGKSQGPQLIGEPQLHGVPIICFSQVDHRRGLRSQRRLNHCERGKNRGVRRVVGVDGRSALLARRMSSANTSFIE